MNGSSGSGTETSASFGRQLAAVLGGVEPQGLDVPQQRDPLLQPALGAADAFIEGTRASAKSAGGRFDLGGPGFQGLGLPEGQVS